ncbi:MAG: CehA/McbA family metallohydrolase, partial [Polyangiaceae bacterium]
VDAKGKKVEPDPGAHVLLLQKGTEVLTIAATKSGIAAEIPPGEYDVVYGSGGGRKGEGQPVHVKLGANREASAKIVVSEGARVDLMCSSSTEPANAMPCKFSFDSLDGTAPVDFGPGGSAGPAKNQITTATGILHDFPISPGNYRVTASRGPEWDTAAKDITLAPGKSGEVHATLTRVVDTKGYLGCDFHQHSMLGADAPTSTRDRVISNVAEGVEVAVASEHNIVADFTPYVNELHLERELVEIPGDEITTDAALVPWGHMNVFPLHPDPTKPRDGAIDASLTPTQVIDLAAKIPYPHVVQINHPRAWNIGYFDLAKYDPKTGLAGAPWYDGRFDAVEVWNGRNIESRDKVRTDYFSLLMHGHPVTPTANTDTHGVIGQEAGYPRTFVRVDDDGPTTGWNDARSADLVKGIVERRDVVLTNGPFLKVDVNGVGIGAIAKGKHLLVHVVVQSAPWVTVDKIGLTFGSGASLERPLVTKLNGAGALEGVVDFQVASPKDDVVSVWVSGSKPMTPVLNGDPSEIMPYAMTGAIWIDADGDGKTLGRETKPAAKK